MKFIVSMFALSLTTAAFASKLPQIDAKSVICQELQNFVSENVSVKVQYRLLGLPLKMIVNKNESCKYVNQYPVPAIVKTADNSRCNAGFQCLTESHGEGQMVAPADLTIGSDELSGAGENYGGYEGNGINANGDLSNYYGN